eukprot:TRINITY_DN2690_c0_g1_i1.p3 TRINITY_DN2690_c0_g1~~TRINITY_DN2690_c0_g1_i1.p3  ORF type:complete len:72 (+),score=18.31 TRINITY_DN2690_c0_g1_i1:528-743(+)
MLAQTPRSHVQAVDFPAIAYFLWRMEAYFCFRFTILCLTIVYLSLFLLLLVPHVLCVDTGRSSETAKAHRG